MRESRGKGSDAVAVVGESKGMEDSGMSEFYGIVRGNRGEASRGGSKDSGIVTYAASWEGAVQVNVGNNEDGDAVYVVYLVPWKGVGEERELASGKFKEG